MNQTQMWENDGIGYATTRRGFLGGLAALGAGAVLPGGVGRVCGGAGARWLVTCRDAILKDVGRPDCWAALKWLGVDGIELDIDDKLGCPGMVPGEVAYGVADDAAVDRLRGECERRGVKIPAFCMHNRFDERLERELEWIARLIEIGPGLGTTVIRIDVVPRKTPADAFLDFAIDLGKRLCALAEGKDVRFAIENHGKVTNDPAFLRRLFAAVASPKLGVTLDPMNLYWFGHPLSEVYKICEELAPRAFHTHCKNLRYPEEKREERRPMGWEYAKHAAPVYDGDVDFRRVSAILQAAGYRGDLCLENECARRFPAEERPEIFRREIACMKEIVAG